VKVTAVVSSAGRCFEKEVKVPVEVEVVALPRALRMLAAALGYAALTYAKPGKIIPVATAVRTTADSWIRRALSTTPFSPP